MGKTNSFRFNFFCSRRSLVQFLSYLLSDSNIYQFRLLVFFLLLLPLPLLFALHFSCTIILYMLLRKGVVVLRFLVYGVNMDQIWVCFVTLKLRTSKSADPRLILFAVIQAWMSLTSLFHTYSRVDQHQMGLGQIITTGRRIDFNGIPDLLVRGRFQSYCCTFLFLFYAFTPSTTTTAFFFPFTFVIGYGSLSVKLGWIGVGFLWIWVSYLK